MQEGGEQRAPPPLPTQSDVCDDSNPSPSSVYAASAQNKKRERPDNNSSISNKEDSCDEGCLSPQKRECLDRQGSPNTLTIQQLMDAMRQEKLLSQRVIRAGVDIVNLKEECLQKFVKSGGVAILDDWLQECHRVKSGDESPKSKDSEDKVDGLIAAILQALEGLPIDLEALKECSIGKSVNQLRGYKNTEFHKKAKKLVDAWKKRVDYEMKQDNIHSDSSHIVISECSSQQQPDCRAIENDQVMTESTETKLCSSNCQHDSPKTVKVDERSSTSNKNDEDHSISLQCSSSVTNNLAIIDIGNPSVTAKGCSEDTVTAKGCSEDTVTAKGCSEDKAENPAPSQPHKSEGKSSRSGSGSKKTDSSNQASAVQGVVNEYRKKLRSSSSSIATNNTTTHCNANNEPHIQNNAEGKNTNCLTGKGKSDNSLFVSDSLTASKCHSSESTIGSSDDSRENRTTVIPNDGTGVSSSKIKQNYGTTNLTPKSFKKSQNSEHQETFKKTEQNQGVSENAGQKSEPSEENQALQFDGRVKCVQSVRSAKGHESKEAKFENDSDESGIKKSPNGKVNETVVDESVLPSVNENYNGKINYNCDTYTTKKYSDDSNEPPSQYIDLHRGTVVRIDFDLNESLSEDHFTREQSPLKGTAERATSAFHSAELLSKNDSSLEITSPSNQVRNVNNFDLNVADHENTLENNVPLTGVRQGGFDLNCCGEDTETEISSTSENQLNPKPMKLEFDLNEGPSTDAALVEQVVLPASSSRYISHSLNGQANSGDLTIWPSSSSKPSVAPFSIPDCDKIELSSIRPTQVFNAIPPKPISSVIYSQTSPFLECGPMPTFTYNHVPFAADPNLVVPKIEINATPPSQGMWSRLNSPSVRSPFLVNVQSDPRGSSSLYTSGRPEQSIFCNNTGPSFINYREILSAQERLVNLNATTTFEEQMRILQQSGHRF